MSKGVLAPLEQLVRNWNRAELDMRVLHGGLPGSGYDKLADGYGTCADELAAVLAALPGLQPVDVEQLIDTTTEYFCRFNTDAESEVCSCVAHQFRRRLRPAFSAFRQWQPMETMPKEGHVIVCWNLQPQYDVLTYADYLECGVEPPAFGWMHLPLAAALPGLGGPQEPECALHQYNIDNILAGTARCEICGRTKDEIQRYGLSVPAPQEPAP